MDGKGFGVVAEKTFNAGDLVYEEAPLILWNSEDGMKTQLVNVVAAVVVLISVLLLLAFNAVGLVPLPLLTAGAFVLWRRGELAMPDELREQYDQLSSEQQEQLKGLSDCSSGEKTMLCGCNGAKKYHRRLHITKATAVAGVVSALAVV